MTTFDKVMLGFGVWLYIVSFASGCMAFYLRVRIHEFKGKDHIDAIWYLCVAIFFYGAANDYL